MNPATLSLAEVARFLDAYLEAGAYRAVRTRDGSGDQNGIYRASARPVSHLTLALEPWPGAERTITEGKTDALFLHRPWQLTAGQSVALEAADTGVLAYHLSFDEHLTLGSNPLLGAELDLQTPLAVLGYKEGRPLGMLGRLNAAVTVESVLGRLRLVFGGLESVCLGGDDTGRMIGSIAVVGAMTDALVWEAHARGAGLYVTGQLRQPASAAVRETKMAVAVVGHFRSEIWGLRALANLLREHLKIAVAVVEVPEQAEMSPPHPDRTPL